MRLFWGILIFLLGIYFLGANVGAWSYADLTRIWQFWPLLIVLLGISLLVRSWEFGWIVVLAAFILSVSFVAYAFRHPDRFHLKEINIHQNVQEYNISESLSSSAQAASIFIDTGAVNLNVKSDSDKLIDGSLKSSFANPDLSVTELGGNVVATLKTTNQNGIPGLGLKNDLTLSLTKVIPIDLSINSGAASMNLDLTDAKLRTLLVETGASSLNIDLGEDTLPDAKLVIKAGASSINIKTPEDIGVKITAKTGLSDKSFEGFDKVGSNEYHSKNYNSVNKRIEISIDAGVSSINIGSK